MVVEYRDMVTIFRDRVQGMMKKGTTCSDEGSCHPTPTTLGHNQPRSLERARIRATGRRLPRP